MTSEMLEYSCGGGCCCLEEIGGWSMEGCCTRIGTDTVVLSLGTSFSISILGLADGARLGRCLGLFADTLNLLESGFVPERKMRKFSIK